MTEADLNKNNDRAALGVYIGLCIIIAAGLLTVYFSSDSVGQLVGTDGYTRLTRVRDLYQTGNWYHPAPMRTNTPYGVYLHWTRPFDVLLLAGAVPLSGMIGFEAALFWWGVFISPVLLVVTLIALYWAVKVLLSKDAPYFIVFIVVTQFGFAASFQPARPDHHSLLALLFILLIGFVLRFVMRPHKKSTCWLAGAIATIAVWISIESLVVVGLMICAMGLVWIIQEDDFLKKNFHFSMTIFISSCLCLLLERPLSNIQTSELDRFSIVYCILFGLVAVFWMVASIIDRLGEYLRSRIGRVLYSVPACLVIASVMWLLYPRFYQGALGDMDPRIIPIWFDYIQEIQPLFSKSGSLMQFVQTLGPLLVGMLFFVFILKKTKASKRNGWLVLLFMTLPFSILAFYQVRWTVYPQILLSIVMAELLYRTLDSLKDRGSILLRALAKSAIIILFSIGFLSLGLVADTVLDRQDANNANEDVSLVTMCKYLNQKKQTNNRNLRLLTYGNFAGEILYRTGCEVVGTNCHRNGQGIFDNYTAMTAEIDEDAFEILHKRDIDFVLLHSEKTPSIIQEQTNKHSTFIQRLRDGEIPPWLRKVELPKELSKDFLLFKTNF